jgi:hypothetical protein
VLANPPFVPAPAGLAGTLTSNGGPEGNTLVDILLAQLDHLLHADGEAFIYVMQLVTEDCPIISKSIEKYLPTRNTELTPVQVEVMPLDYYIDAYIQCFPDKESDIKQWESELRQRHTSKLGIQHYIVHTQPKRPGHSAWEISENLARKNGDQMHYPAASNRELARARVLENFVPRT